MLPVHNAYLTFARDVGDKIFSVIIPEMPWAGYGVTGLSLLLFIIYLFYGGPSRAFKISGITFLLLMFVLFSIHTLAHLFGIRAA